MGRAEPPPDLALAGRHYRHVRTFKHDFFAMTALYEGQGGKIVLKVGRTAGFFGVPLAWIGRFLMRREVRLLKLVQPIEGVPRFLGTCGETGFVHEYIEGGPLSKEEQLDDEFFPRLEKMLDEFHALDLAYVDLEKRENILRGDDGRPYLIDFQISWRLPANRGGRTWIARRIVGVLQASDRYHLMKHWRRARPDQLSPDQIAESYRAPFWIAWHRALFRPVTRFRRQVLVWLGARSSAIGRSPG